jgi:hypothetical protein
VFGDDIKEFAGHFHPGVVRVGTEAEVQIVDAANRSAINS